MSETGSDERAPSGGSWTVRPAEPAVRGGRASGTNDSAGPDRRSTALSELVQELRSRATNPPATARRPRVGFVGVDWAHSEQLSELAKSGLVDARSVTDPSAAVAHEGAARLRNVAPNVRVLADVQQMLLEPLDGLVFGRRVPYPVHSIAETLSRRVAVFCQHPLARTAAEAEQLVGLARSCDRLLTVDFHYGHLSGVAEMAALVRDGAIGEVFGAELSHHCSRGPDASPDTMAGTHGCLLELGGHLVDLALEVLDAPPVHGVRARRYASGRLLEAGMTAVADDHASAELMVGRGVTVRLACSWRASIGEEQRVDALFLGTRGSLRLRNVQGSTAAFRVEHYEGTRCRPLGGAHGGALDVGHGRAATAWARRLAVDASFDDDALRIPLVAATIDRLLAAAP